jgi:hypothetical protein
MADDERFVHQRRDRVVDGGPSQVVAPSHLLSRLQTETSGENRDAFQNATLGVGK